MYQSSDEIRRDYTALLVPFTEALKTYNYYVKSLTDKSKFRTFFTTELEYNVLKVLHKNVMEFAPQVKALNTAIVDSLRVVDNPAYASYFLGNLRKWKDLISYSDSMFSNFKDNIAIANKELAENNMEGLLNMLDRDYESCKDFYNDWHRSIGIIIGDIQHIYEFENIDSSDFDLEKELVAVAQDEAEESERKQAQQIQVMKEKISQYKAIMMYMTPDLIDEFCKRVTEGMDDDTPEEIQRVVDENLCEVNDDLSEQHLILVDSESSEEDKDEANYLIQDIIDEATLPEWGLMVKRAGMEINPRRAKREMTLRYLLDQDDYYANLVLKLKQQYNDCDRARMEVMEMIMQEYSLY